VCFDAQHGKEQTNKSSRVKRQPTEWEKSIVNHIADKGLISRPYKVFQQLSNKRRTKACLKTEQRT
jgi:hypothetical protein